MPMRSVLLACLLLACLPSIAQDYSILEYGAVPNKSVNSTKALQAAIDACAERGGGRVVVPAGEYLIGTVQLKSNVELHLSQGATLFGSRKVEDYRKTGYVNMYALIYAEKAHHVSITGKGTIDGQAEYRYGPMDVVDNFIEKETAIAQASGIDMRRYYNVDPVAYLVAFEECQFVNVEGISMINSQFWTLHLLWCEKAWIRGCYLYSDLVQGVNSDGIDIDGCREVTVSDCIIETADDAVCLKAHRYAGKYRACEDITVTNCVTTSTSAALKIGTGTVGDFRRIVFSNCTVKNTNRALNIVGRHGGTIEDILFTNITVECNRKHYNWWGDGELFKLVIMNEHDSIPVSAIRRVTISNILATVQGTSQLIGLAKNGKVHAIEDITLSNIRLKMVPESTADKRATHAIHAEHVKGLKIEDVTIDWSTEATEPKWQSAISLSSVEGVELESVTARAGGNAPVFRLESVQQAVVRQCRATAGTLVELAGKLPAPVLLEGNSPASAQPLYRLAPGVSGKAVQVKK